MDEQGGPLAGFRIIDLSTVLMGPYATQFLGDFGADVVKVEPPAGDLTRTIGPERSEGMGAIFLNANRSKRSIVIDLKTAEGKALLLELCAEADVLVYNIRPAAMARLGLSYDEVAAVNPRIIYAGLYGFGQTGPYAAHPAYDDLIQGAATLPYAFLRAGSDEPRYVPTAMADRVVGLTALSAILAALLARGTTGKGQRVEVPMFETMTSFVLNDHMGGLTFDPPVDSGGYPRQLSQNRKPYQTADGYICALIYTDGQWRSFLKAVGEPERMTDDPRFSNFPARMRHIDEVYGWLADVFLARGSDDWIALLNSVDVPVMKMHTFESVMEDPHLTAVGFFQKTEHPTEGPIVSMANPVTMSGTPVAPPRLAPRLGWNSREILAGMGKDDATIEDLIRSGVVSAADRPPAAGT